MSTLFGLALVTNLGGVGKSTSADIVYCILEARGLKPLGIDLDQNACGFARRIGAEIRIGKADDIQFLDAQLMEAIEDRRPLIIDFAANSMNSMVTIRWLKKAIAAFSKQDRKFYVASVLSPNKPGSGVELANSLDVFVGLGAQAMVVKNNRDGSNNFDQLPAELSKTKISIPFVLPGFQAFRQSHQQSLHRLLLEAPAGYTLACGYWLSVVSGVVRQLAEIGILPDAADFLKTYPSLQAFDRQKLRYNVPSLAAASDTSILQNINQSAALSQLDSVNINDPIAMRRFVSQLQVKSA